MERTEEALRERVRETPLSERLTTCEKYIASMCAERRPPKMTIPLQHYDEDFYIYTTLADAQATIADLQGQVEAAQEWLSLCQHELGSVRIDRAILQQRVAQLEQERDAFESHAIDLQADHARVLGLVQALPVAGLPVEHARSDDFVVLQANGEWMVHTYNYWAKFATEEEARAYIALLEYRASLPAQPAQGGAVSKPVTTCNRHSDCDAADEKARAKGALNADHCHDDCCSECFGN